MNRGYSLIEALLIIAIIVIVASIVLPLLHQAIVKYSISTVAVEAEILYDAFKKHYASQNGYPSEFGDPVFELDTFEPLRSAGLYVGDITTELLDGKADAYDSPDDRGQNREFWLEMTLKADPSVRVLVADSDDAPLSGGDYVDGIFLYRNGELRRIDDLD